MTPADRIAADCENCKRLQAEIDRLKKSIQHYRENEREHDRELRDASRCGYYQREQEERGEPYGTY